MNNIKLKLNRRFKFNFRLKINLLIFNILLTKSLKRLII